MTTKRLGILFTFPLIALGIAAYFTLPNPVDWTIFYRPATLELIAGRTPYTVGSFLNPPWILLPLIAFAVLPYRIGVAALFITNVIIFFYIGWRLKARPVAFVALFCSLPVIVCLLFGQIDGLVLLGLFLPRPVGLIFLLAKPQIGWVVALLWLVEAWRVGKMKQVTYVFSPVAACFLVSFLLYGPWLFQADFSSLVATDHNTSLWPGSLVVGLPLLIYSLRQRKQNCAFISTPFLSPYVAPQSWAIALLGLIPYEFEIVAASLASWVFFISRLEIFEFLFGKVLMP